MQEKLDQLKAAKQPEPIRSDDAGALDLGPRNVVRDGQNPDILAPPAKGTPQNIRYFKDFDFKIKKACNAAKEH